MHQYASSSSNIPDALKHASSLECRPVSMKTNTSLPKIIVNKNKIEELKSNNVIPQNIETFVPVSSSAPIKMEDIKGAKRLVLPPKSRLGFNVELNQRGKRSVKERLGSIVDTNKHNCEIYELEEGDSLLEDSKEEEDVSHEEKCLREGAIKTIDLRNRLSRKETSLRENNFKFDIYSGAKHKVERTSLMREDNLSLSSDPESYKDEDDDSYKDEEESENVLFVRKSKKSKSKKEKKKKEKSKEHKASKLKRKIEKAEKIKKKLEKKMLAKKDKGGIPIKPSPSLAAMIADKREGELFSQKKNSNPDKISSLELYVHDVKAKKREKVHQKRDKKSNSKERMQKLNDDEKTAKVKRIKSICDLEKKKSVEIKSDSNQDLLKLAKNPDDLRILKRKHETESSRKISIVKTSGSIKRPKILKNISNSVLKKKESVRSVLNDVDSLLKSAGEQNLLNDKSNFECDSKESDDVMKQLDEIINS